MAGKIDDFFWRAMDGWRRVFSKSSYAISIKNSWVHPTKRGTRGGKMILCAECNKPEQYGKIHIDHIEPVIPVDTPAREMSWDTIYQRLFCGIENLQPLCRKCHKKKSAEEVSLRAKHKRAAKSATFKERLQPIKDAPSELLQIYNNVLT